MTTEITEKMLAAGAGVLAQRLSAHRNDYSNIAHAVYLAMRNASPDGVPCIGGPSTIAIAGQTWVGGTVPCTGAPPTVATEKDLT